MWTGYVGNDGKPAAARLSIMPKPAMAGRTYPERLVRRPAVSWKVYQDTGVGLTADGVLGLDTDDEPYIGNYGDNSLLYFHQYQNAKPGNRRSYQGARQDRNHHRSRRHVIRLFPAMTSMNGTLPQVSWIVAPEAYCEHPNWPAELWRLVRIAVPRRADRPIPRDVEQDRALLLTYRRE